MTRGRWLAVALVGAGVVVHLIAPVWVELVAALVAVLVWATWATCPPEVSMGRHIASELGELVLDAVRAVVRVVVGILLVSAALVASWSFVSAHIGQAVDQARQSAVDAVTPDPSDLGGWLKSWTG